MSNSDYKNFRYDDFDDRYDDYSHRRPSASAGRRNTASSDRQSRSERRTYTERQDSSFRRSSEPVPDFLYDARGSRVKKSKVTGEFLRTLLFFVLPYLIINGIILALVTATPKITIDMGQTNDYQSVTVNFKISCLLPLEETTVTLNSEPISYSKDGSNYTALVTKNGNFYVSAVAKNGMKSSANIDIGILDDTPPVIDDSSCHIEEGILTFKVADTQSGVDWSQIYATAPDGTRIVPKSIDKSSGTVTIPMDVDQMELHVADMVGNEHTATVTATTEQLTVNGPVVE